MNFKQADVDELRRILNLCKTVGIDSIVLANGKVMGATTSRKMIIVSDTTLSIDPKVGMGIGRVSELEKRLALFGDTVAITDELGKSGEVMRLNMVAGRTKAQFRCTATSLIPHPKENADTPFAVLTLSKAEAATLVKAAKTFGAENIIFKIAASGDVHIECVDSTNDQFSTCAEKQAEFIGEVETALFTYSADYLTTVLDVGTRDADSIDLIFGQAGSITAMVRGHTLMVASNVNED